MFSKIESSLQLKIVAYFSLLSLITILLVAWAANQRSRDALQNSVIDRLVVATSLKETQVNNWVETQRKDLLFIAQLPDISKQAEIVLQKNHNDPQFKESYRSLSFLLQHVSTIKTNMRQISIVSKTGVIIVSTNKQSEQTYQSLGNNTTYFTQDTSRKVIPSIYHIQKTGVAAMTFAAPLVNNRDEIFGVVAIDLDLKAFDDIVRQRTGLGNTGETYLIGRLGGKNIFISSPEIRNDQLAQKLANGITSLAIAAVSRGEKGYGSYKNYANIPVLGSYTWMDNLNLGLISEMSQVEAFAPANQLAKEIILIGLTSASLLLFAVYLVSSKISQPILAIAKAANAVYEGHSDVKAPVVTNDEIGQLARSFNRMTAQVNFALEELSQSELRFRSLFEQAAVGFAQIEAESGRFVRVNKRYCDIVGYSQQELESLSFQEITHSKDLPRDLTNVNLLLTGKLDSFSVEKRYIRKDGEIIWVRLTVSRMWPSRDKSKYHIAVIEDITPHKQAELAVIESQRLAAIGETVSGIAHDFNNVLQGILGTIEVILSQKETP